MGVNARIEPGGYVVIDTAAWLTAPTGGPDEDLTTDLDTWARRHADAEADDSRCRDWPRVARDWAVHRGHELVEPELIAHAETRLDAEIWILRASVGRYKIAVVGINHDPPTVHAESCTDPYDWFDADTVEISCPGGHGWYWRTGRELLTADGRFTTITAVFGPDLDAPFSPCPVCTAHRDDARSAPCPCDGTPWIVCPALGCGRRCDVELPGQV